MGQGEVLLEEGLAGEEEDLKEEDREDQEDGEGMVPEEGVPAEGEGALVEGRNPEEGDQEAVVPKEAAQTGQGRAQEEEVCPHVEAQPEEEGDPGLEEGGQGGRGEQGGLEEALGGPAYLENVVGALQDQGDQGSGLGQGVQGTCSCLDHPWGTLVTHRGAQPYLPQTSVPTECLSFYVTASQTGLRTVCYMV